MSSGGGASSFNGNGVDVTVSLDSGGTNICKERSVSQQKQYERVDFTVPFFYRWTEYKCAVGFQAGIHFLWLCVYISFFFFAFA